MDKEEIQQIIDKAYPLIQRYLVKGKNPILRLNYIEIFMLD